MAESICSVEMLMKQSSFVRQERFMRITLDGTPKWQAMTWFNQSENKDLKRLVFYTDAEAND